jgi:6-phosphogluconolactonase (cycloisomerase 2 family)
MRGSGSAFASVALCLVAAFATQGCGGGKHIGFFGSSAGNTAPVSISFAGYVPVGAPEAFTTANLSAQNAATFEFLTGLIPAGRTAADVVVLFRNDTTGTVTVLPAINLNAGLETLTVNLTGAGTYQPEAPVTPDAGHSSITVTPSSAVPADGTSLATILVTVRDANGDPLSGQTVTVVATGSNNTLTQASGPTNLLGEAQATLASTTAETKTVTVTINASSTKPVPLPAVSVVFGTTGAPSAANSTVTVTPGTVTADGVSTAQVAVVVRDANGATLPGQSVSVAAVGTLALVSQAATTSDAGGEVQATIASPYFGTKTIVVTAGGVTLNAQPTVTFVSAGRNVYVGNGTNGSFSIFAANNGPGGTGQLRPMVSQATGSPSSIAVDNRSRFAFSTEGTNLVVRRLAGIDGSGAFDNLTALPATALGGTGGFEVAVDPSCRFVYVAMSGTLNIQSYVVDAATGVVDATTLETTPVYGLGGFQAAGQIGSIAMHPTGRYLYAVNWDPSGTNKPSLVAFAIDATTGHLTRVGAPVGMGLPAGQPGYICCDPQGRYVVGVDQLNQDIYIYAVNPGTGEPTSLDWVHMDSEPRKPIVDGSGQFIYVPMVSGTNPNAVEVYYVNASLLGAPGPILFPRSSPPAFPVGGTLPSDAPEGPILATEPSGHFLQAIAQGNNEIVTFSIDPVLGSLSNAQAVRTQPGPASIATSIGASPIRYVPKEVAVADAAATKNVQALVITQATGALAAATQTTVNPGQGAAPTSIAADARGQFVVTGDGPSMTVSLETVDPPAATGTFFYDGTTAPSQANVAVAAAGTAPYFVGFSGSTAFTLAVSLGALTENTAASTAAAPAGGAVDPTGQWVYALESGGVEVLPLTLATGAIGAANGLSVAPATPSAIAIAPSGRFAYVAVGTIISQTAVSATDGTIAPLASGSVSTQAPVVGLAADPFGAYVFALNQDGSVTGYSVNRVYQGANEGELTQLAPVTVIPGTVTPAGIAIEPTGSFLYVVDAGKNSVTLLTINRATGALTVGASTTAGVGPTAVTVVGGPE